MFALKIESDSMSSEFRIGDFIVVDMDVKIKNKDYIIVRDKISKEAILRQYHEKGRIETLRALNPEYPDIPLNNNNQYEVIGKVVQKIKEY